MQRKTKSGKSVLGGLVVELVDTQDELRKIQREIGRMNNRTQIEYLMKNRQNLLTRFESLKLEVTKKIPDFDPVDLRIFQCIYRVLSVYGKSVCESILWSFECEAKVQPLRIVDYPATFIACVGKTFGKRSSKEIENTMLFEICNEFGLQLSRRASLGDAIKLVKSSVKQPADEEAVRARNRTK